MTEPHNMATAQGVGKRGVGFDIAETRRVKGQAVTVQ